MHKYLQEIEQITSQAGKTVPLQRKAFKLGYSFDNMEFEEQLEIWDFIWRNTKDFRTDMFCMYFLELNIKNREHMIKSWSVIQLWQDKIGRWETSDSIAKIFAQILEYDSKLILPTYKKWNVSDNLWKRRQSIVGLLYYSSHRKRYLPFHALIVMVKPLLTDKAYYVQKGVGWTLKEIGKIYGKEQEKFLFDNADQISPLAYSAATEKWSKDKREELKAIRKAARLKQ